MGLSQTRQTKTALCLVEAASAKFPCVILVDPVGRDHRLMLKCFVSFPFRCTLDSFLARSFPIFGLSVLLYILVSPIGPSSRLDDFFFCSFSSWSYRQSHFCSCNRQSCSHFNQNSSTVANEQYNVHLTRRSIHFTPTIQLQDLAPAWSNNCSYSAALSHPCA